MHPSPCGELWPRANARLSVCCLRILHVDAIFSGDDTYRGHAREQTVVDDAHGRLELLTCGHRILDGCLELEVHDVVPVVCDCRFVAVGFVVGDVAQSQHRLATGECGKLGDLPHSVLVTEWNDLHRDGETGAQAIAQLGLVHDYDEFLRTELNNLLAEKGTTATLDEVQLRVHLISTVDGYIKVGVGVQSRQRDAQALGLLFGADGCRDGNDILQLTALQLHTHALNCIVSRRACAQADDSAAPHVVVDCFVANLLLQLVLCCCHDHRHRTAAALCATRCTRNGRDNCRGRCKGSRRAGSAA
mmetsp:Transcript_114069/g.368951  ORF Transcript_114069/g.368951 Transcript_114069/m.368951 type:complete len:303 (+) Transcript_114069:90-998(+)